MRNLYAWIRRLLPSGMKGYLTALLYLTGIKPTVNKKVKSPFNKGIVVLSADFEMAWAFRFSKRKRNLAEETGLQERNNVPGLLSLFEKYRIPVTWATVGHLMLDSCQRGSDGLPHQEMPRPPYFENKNWLFEQGDWYDADPCTDYKSSPAWYAPDLVAQITGSEVHHEIGCHTFSHIDCTDKNCPSGLLEAELKMCIDIAREKGIQLKSMVFPGGTLGNFSMLQTLGFTNYRKSLKYHIDLPVIDQFGLVQIPSSFNLEKPKDNWSANFCIRIATAFVKKAAKHNLVAHLWFHPSMSTWYLENVLPGVLGFLRKMEDENKIEVLTMEQLTGKFLSLKN